MKYHPVPSAFFIAVENIECNKTAKYVFFTHCNFSILW